MTLHVKLMYFINMTCLNVAITKNDKVKIYYFHKKKNNN